MATLKYSRSKATFKTQRLHYFITIQKFQKLDYVSPAELDTVERFLRDDIKDLQILSKVYELGGKYYQLHTHLIISTFHDIYFKKYSKYGNFRVWWKPVYNERTLNQYFQKQSTNKYEQEYLHALNHYRNHYGF